MFFNQIVGVMPVLLLTLGVEFNYFRRTLTDAGQRAATAATVTVMAAGLVGALSTLPWDGQGCDDVLSSWHEYLAFLFAVQGIFTGLATRCGCLLPAHPTLPLPATSRFSVAAGQKDSSWATGKSLVTRLTGHRRGHSNGAIPTLG